MMFERLAFRIKMRSFLDGAMRLTSNLKKVPQCASLMQALG